MVQADYNPLITEDYSRALAKFQRVADLYPESAIAIWCVGMFYYYSGQSEKALAAYKKSVELQPNLAKGYESIAWVYNYKKDNPLYSSEEALKYLNMAIAKGASAINDRYYAEFEVQVYYTNQMYDKTIDKIELYQTYGKQYRDSENLQTVLKWAKQKNAAAKLVG
jgi:tetratricopeptide (TPR) repeat protein